MGPSNVLSRQLGGDQGRCHSCPAGRGHQERADRRGAENSDGEIENVKFWTQFQFLLDRSSNQDLLSTLSMYSDVLTEFIAFLMQISQPRLCRMQLQYNVEYCRR